MANYELRIDTQELKKALDVLSTVVNKKNALPILADACVRFDRQRKLFSIEATNTEQHLRLECWTPDEKAPQGERPWMFLDGDSKEQPLDAFCINVQSFREAFATLPATPATCYLKMQDGGGSIRVCYGKGECTLPVELATEFPTMPQVVTKDGEQREGVSPVVRFSMETARLLPTIAAARCCAANDELRPVMNTVVIDAFHDRMVIVASDGHSLYRQNVDTGMGWLKYGEFGATDSAKLLIPTQALTPLMKALGQAESFTVTADTQRISFETTDGIVRLTTVCIEGRYPNYESVIPNDLPHRVTVDRQELQATLNRITIFSEAASNLAIMQREDDDHLVLTAADDTFGRKATEQVAIINPDTTLPERTPIGFKIATMTKLLQCITTDNVVLEAGTPDRAMLLREDTTVSGLTLLLMPMLVNQ